MEPNDREPIPILNDARLAPLIEAHDDDLDAAIECVIAEMRPVTAKILARYRRAVVAPEDVDDIVATVDLRLLEKLRGVTQSDHEAIESLESYVAKVTYNTINDHLRRRFPERARLKARLRRALMNEPRLAVWSTPRGTACGLREWRMDRVVETIAAQTIRPPREAYHHEQPGEAILALLTTIGKPVFFDDLVDVIAEIWNVTDSTAIRLDPNEQRSEEQPAIERLINRDDVVFLWREIRQLRPMQRKALLLSLRYGGTMDIVATLTLAGVATFDEVAATLEMPPGDLAAIWNALPLDDLRIADILQVTRQQVINLRLAARKRLARRFSAMMNT